MNATKSEKKRIRNRRKHRDESGRFSFTHRNGQSSRKNCQKQITTNSKTNQNSMKPKPNITANILANDSCNGLYKIHFFFSFEFKPISN